MIERHYDEEALVTMLDSGADTSDPHLSACVECAEKLETFRLVTDALHDPATWDKRQLDLTPNPHTIATLRAFADTMAAEDAAAQAHIADLLAGPREAWMAKLSAHPEYRTAGVVRGLIAATDRALDTMPADAVQITVLATEIAEHLDPATHRPDTLARLCGGAWRERAYALFYTGQMADAEEAVATAEARFSGCVVDEYELARVGIVRALVDRGLENYVPASAHAKQSAASFQSFGDERRMSSALLAEVNARFSRGEFTAAHDMLEVLNTAVTRRDDVQTQAIVLGNLGYCEWKLGHISQALQYQEAAALLFERTGNRTAAVRARWNTASILAGEGQIDEAMRRFRAIHAEFASVGMTGAATLASLDLAELLLAKGEHFSEVEEICRTAMASFETAKTTHTAGALTALGLMREAVAARSATPALARHVREYVRRLPQEPHLLFAMPLS